MDINTIPHAEIRHNIDRSWTMRLLNIILESKGGDDLDEVCATLGALDDPRALELLLSVVADSSQPDHLRQAAIDVLSSGCISCTESDRRGWWASGDPFLQRLAILEARTSESDILLAILRDAGHVFHKEAISSLEFGFEEPDFLKFSIRALSHQNPDVRVVAARNMLWNEPVMAEDGLIANLWGDDDDAAAESADVLVWYSSKRVHLAFDELRKHGPAHRQEDAQNCMYYFLEDVKYVLEHLDSCGREHFLQWLSPAKYESDSRAVPEAKIVQSRDNAELKKDQSLISDASEIIALFDDLDGCWNGKAYGSVDWKSVCFSHRLILADYFRSHTDHAVRDIACKPLSMWDRADILVEFLSDRCGGVRKSAAYYLRYVSLDSALALPLWNALTDVNCTSTRARETLESYVIHAPRLEAVDRLADIALSDRRISRVETALYELIRLQSHSQMHELLSLLAKPPMINWNIHTILVDYCNSQKIRIPNFVELCRADDLRLQEKLAEYFSRGYHMQQNGFEIPGAGNGNRKNIRRRGQASSRVYAQA